MPAPYKFHINIDDDDGGGGGGDDDEDDDGDTQRLNIEKMNSSVS